MNKASTRTTRATTRKSNVTSRRDDNNTNRLPKFSGISSKTESGFFQNFRYLNNIVRQNEYLRERIVSLKKRIGYLNNDKTRLDAVLVNMTKQMSWQTEKLTNSFAVTPVGQSKLCLLNWLSTHNKNGEVCPCGDCDFTRDLLKKIDSYYAVVE